ncbi:MAG TPA: hypothetical protein VMU65_14935 [Candidatus Saccharimonadales bacterium]|nr:hypothetical protein [Candidatus Saccharimonadales bacterium]
MGEPQDDRTPASPDYESMMALWMRERMTPAEWAARNAHRILMWSGPTDRYRDPELDRWIQDLGRVLSAAGVVEEARRRYLTDAERQWAEQRELEEF